MFPIEEAIKKGTIVMNLLSDAAQSQTWPTVARLITKGKTLYFSHGFSVVYKEDTKVIPPKDVDVILVAPKGSGRTVRTLFKEGRGINSSIAVFQDVTGKAQEKAIALGVAIGSGYMYDTTFEKEVYSDLYGERGVVRTVCSIQSCDKHIHASTSLWERSVCSEHFDDSHSADLTDFRGFIPSSIPGPPQKWSHAVGGFQRNRRGGDPIPLPFDWSEGVRFVV